ncbi:MAG: hypothetical protein H6742_11575 [Alphaproteobacteria bacterium]|nr:hypothetical protein [Alphaproteobacteria bacterium]
MTFRLLALAVVGLLAGCHPAAATVDVAATADAWPSPPPDALAAWSHALAHEGAEPATGSLQRIHGDFAQLTPDQQRQARDAAASIISDCPYNRSMVQVPLVLQQVLARHDDPALSAVKAGVDAHVAVLRDLGVDALPLPAAGRNLDRPLVGLTTAAALRDSADPIGETRVLVDQIEGLVAAYDADTVARITTAADTLAKATGGQWALEGQLVGLQKELQRVLLVVEDPALRVELIALDGLLAELVRQAC